MCEDRIRILAMVHFDLKRIAPLSGFPLTEAMGAAFKRQLDLLPNTYRALGSSGKRGRFPGKNIT